MSTQWIENALKLLDPALKDHPVLSAIAAGLAILIFASLLWQRNWYFLRERSLLLSAKREELLLELVKNEPMETIHPLRLEAAFTRAFGYSLSSQLIRFSFRHENPTQMMLLLRRGRRYVGLDTNGTALIYKNKKLTLSVIEWALTIGGSVSLIGAVGAAFIACYSPLLHAASLIAIELLVSTWICIDGLVGATNAGFLLQTDRFPKFNPPAPSLESTVKTVEKADDALPIASHRLLNRHERALRVVLRR